MCELCKKEKTQIRSVTDKLIISIDGLKISNSPRKIDHPKYTALEMSTIILGDIFQNYFKDSFIEYVICENCSYVISEVINTKFTMCQNLKEPALVLKIILQRATFDIVDRRLKNNKCKVKIPLELLIKIPSRKEKI